MKIVLTKKVVEEMWSTMNKAWYQKEQVQAEFDRATADLPIRVKLTELHDEWYRLHCLAAAAKNLLHAGVSEMEVPEGNPVVPEPTDARTEAQLFHDGVPLGTV